MEKFIKYSKSNRQINRKKKNMSKAIVLTVKQYCNEQIKTRQRIANNPRNTRSEVEINVAKRLIKFYKNIKEEFIQLNYAKQKPRVKQ